MALRLYNWWQLVGNKNIQYGNTPEGEMPYGSSTDRFFTWRQPARFTRGSDHDEGLIYTHHTRTADGFFSETGTLCPIDLISNSADILMEVRHAGYSGSLPNFANSGMGLSCKIGDIASIANRLATFNVGSLYTASQSFARIRSGGSTIQEGNGSSHSYTRAPRLARRLVRWRATDAGVFTFRHWEPGTTEPSGWDSTYTTAGTAYSDIPAGHMGACFFKAVAANQAGFDGGGGYSFNSMQIYRLGFASDGDVVPVEWTTKAGTAKYGAKPAAKVFLMPPHMLNFAEDVTQDTSSAYSFDDGDAPLLLTAFAFDPAKLQGLWRSQTLFNVGDVVFSSLAPEALAAVCVTATGDKNSGSTLPNFPSDVGGTVSDGDLTWETLGKVEDLAPVTNFYAGS